jgi:hypothetical protein
MPTLYCRPAEPAPVTTTPQLASWDAAGSPGQVKLAVWLEEVDAVFARANVGTGPVAVELGVALADGTAVASGGRDLDNYLLPIAHRIGPQRIAAAFGRKFSGSSSTLAFSPATPMIQPPPADHTHTVTGSASTTAWKQAIHLSLRAAGVQPVRPGPLWLTIAVTTGRFTPSTTGSPTSACTTTSIQPSATT